MAQYLSPGVFVEEVPSAVRPIAGVGTSTAGFIGLVSNDVEMPEKPGEFEFETEKDNKGKVKVDNGGRPILKRDSAGNPILRRNEGGDPIPASFDLAEPGQPKLVTNWQEFQNNFGRGIQNGNRMLAQAVYGFFNNGGTRCWVTRVSDLNKGESSDAPVDQVKEALAEFETIDEIALVAVPMASEIIADNPEESRTRRGAIREMVLSHCEKMQDRFAILDGEEKVDGDLTPETIYKGRDSDYGAVYYPWIDVSGNKDFVPPCGHLAGIYARVDSERGVHKAPANAAIRGALGVQRKVSRSQQDGLNPDGINIIRQFNGTITVWGARTMGGDKNTEFKYVSTRRLVNFIRESIDEGTRWVVFEPNNRGLWQKITRNVSAFLTTLWRQGALFGDTPEQAFFVKCDEETNPSEVRELGQVVTEIGIAVVKPAEFVIFRIMQTAGQTA